MKLEQGGCVVDISTGQVSNTVPQQNDISLSLIRHLSANSIVAQCRQTKESPKILLSNNKGIDIYNTLSEVKCRLSIYREHGYIVLFIPKELVVRCEWNIINAIMSIYMQYNKNILLSTFKLRYMYKYGLLKDMNTFSSYMQIIHQDND